MTKMQIVAKATLTILGTMCIVNLCHNLSMLTYFIWNTSTLRVILFLSAFIILLITIAYLLIFKNNRLASIMAGEGEKLNPESQALWLAVSLRLVAIFYGLMLLSTSIPTILNIVVSPIHIRPLINEIFTFKTFPKSLIFTTRQWSTMIYNFLKARSEEHTSELQSHSFISYAVFCLKKKKKKTNKGRYKYTSPC